MGRYIDSLHSLTLIGAVTYTSLLPPTIVPSAYTSCLQPTRNLIGTHLPSHSFMYIYHLDSPQFIMGPRRHGLTALGYMFITLSTFRVRQLNLGLPLRCELRSVSEPDTYSEKTGTFFRAAASLLSPP
ncbi:hypothetical protein K469DRAFT_712558 [Zopfia rhizophila CBS 207.26]|uniref:Uncharacterized protein n=1 Tax=Zopfia rhizophila CBS 207.26 TaxID=1314779 RepID=A0A6A6ENJ9_9PEZI|nr:hypothetical protein K469DRAFT_712558 [Zopfia rhizophila CBS 207.26]